MIDLPAIGKCHADSPGSHSHVPLTILSSSEVKIRRLRVCMGSPSGVAVGGERRDSLRGSGN
ncbi:hypothetical protein ACFZDJ_44920 [Streptomyces sp. NPDC007896]|uniref:hypothetical protein n=1 Tax=Streptomyces sp. NPDC007896 TaxID=3364784 RepID=UPI0036EAD3CF